MNPLTKVKLINELNQREADLGIKDCVSWHSVYKDSAWIFIGGFPYDLTEGDLICVFSQYGEIANINLVRDKKTGKSKGFCFICYEDQRSTVLAVDNFNGIKIKGRTLRVDHVRNYRPPKDTDDIDDVTKRLREEGCAPKLPSSEEEEEEYAVVVKKQKKDKKEKKKKKEKEEKKREKEKASKDGKRGSEGESRATLPVPVKQEREDSGYEKHSQHRLPQDGAQQEHERHTAWHDDGQLRGRERDRGGDRERQRDKERERDCDSWAAREDERRKDRSRHEREDKDGRKRSQEHGGRQWDGERRTEHSGRERERSNRNREAH